MRFLFPFSKVGGLGGFFTVGIGRISAKRKNRSGTEVRSVAESWKARSALMRNRHEEKKSGGGKGEEKNKKNISTKNKLTKTKDEVK